MLHQLETVRPLGNAEALRPHVRCRSLSSHFLLRLSRDVEAVRLEQLTLKSFEDAHFPDIRSYFPAPRERAATRRRRSRIALAYALGIATCSIGLTVAGIIAALWHMAPWVAKASLAATGLSLALVLLVMMHAMPPDSKEGAA